MALSQDAGMDLWYEITGKEQSHLQTGYCLRRGYEYDDTGDALIRYEAQMGKSNCTLLYITSYGDRRTAPIINPTSLIYQDDSENIVFRTSISEGFQISKGDNILVRRYIISIGDEMNIQNIDGFTLGNSEITDVVDDEPNDPRLGWQLGLEHRISGIY